MKKEQILFVSVSKTGKATMTQTETITVDMDNLFRDLYEILSCRAIEVIYVYLEGKAFLLLADEESKLKENLVPSFALMDDNDNVYDIVLGSFAVVGEEGEDFRALTKKEEKLFLKHLPKRIGLAVKRWKL